MKPKLHITFLTIFLCSLGVTFVQAQDASAATGNLNDVEVNTKEPVQYLHGGEADGVSSNNSQPLNLKTDSVGLQQLPTGRAPANTSKNKSKQQADDDSVLSFNFLYYIFQTYKLQDIIE